MPLELNEAVILAVPSEIGVIVPSELISKTFVLSLSQFKVTSTIWFLKF